MRRKSKLDYGIYGTHVYIEDVLVRKYLQERTSFADRKRMYRDGINPHSITWYLKLD